MEHGWHENNHREVSYFQRKKSQGSLAIGLRVRYRTKYVAE